MGDPFRRVRSGERLEIPAAAWNKMLDSVAIGKGVGSAVPSLSGVADAQPTIVNVRNDSGADLASHAVVEVGAPVFSPTDNEDEFRYRFAFAVDEPTGSADGRVAVLVDPIPDGAIGRAVLVGLAVTKVDVTDSSAKYAKAVASDTAKLATDSSGSIPIVWRESGSSGTKWCVVVVGAPPRTAAEGGWYLITASSARDTGSTPSWTYTLQPVTGFTSGSWTASGSTVTAYNAAEDQNSGRYQNGQSLTPITGGPTVTPTAVTGVVFAKSSGVTISGTLIYLFNEKNPVTGAC